MTAHAGLVLFHRLFRLLDLNCLNHLEEAA